MDLDILAAKLDLLKAKGVKRCFLTDTGIDVEFFAPSAPAEEAPAKVKNAPRGADGLTAEEQLDQYGVVLDAHEE